jgi:outer membrane protein
MQKIIFMFLIVFLLCLTNNLYAAEYSLEELCSIALERAERINITAEDVFIAETGKDKAMSVLFPKLSAFWNYTRYSEDKYTATGSLLQPDSSKTWGMRLDQSFTLNGRELTAFQITKSTIEKTKYDFNSAKEEYILMLAEAYYNVLKTKKALDITKSNVERLTKHRDAAEIRLKVGETTKTAVLRAQAELSGAQSEEIKAQNALEITIIILSRFSGLNEKFDVKETKDYGAEIKDFGTIESLRQAALMGRTDLKSFEMQKKISDDQISYARGAYWPTLSIEGVYSRGDQNPTSASLNKESVYGGVKINFPFFEGGLRMAEVREAKSKNKQANLLYEDKKKAVFVEVESAYLDLKTQGGIKEKFEAQLKFAEDNYNAVTKQFEYGIVNSLDVMDANNLLVQSQRQLTDSQYNYQFAVLKLKRATGALLSTLQTKPITDNNAQK